MLPPLADVIELLILCKMVPFSTEFTMLFRNIYGGSKPPPYNIFVRQTIIYGFIDTRAAYGAVLLLLKLPHYG